MWLDSEKVGVRFDEEWGGMPMEDSLGILRCASVELALEGGSTFFQSRNDSYPLMKKLDSGLVASGVMRKRHGRVLKHTYELKAKLEGNELYLDFKLNVPTTESISRSKVWFLTRWFGKCMVDGKPVKVGEMSPAWKSVKRMAGQPTSVVLYGDRFSLEIQGSTDPSVYFALAKSNKLEAVYGWAEEHIEKGTYAGSFKVIYGGGR